MAAFLIFDCLLDKSFCLNACCVLEHLDFYLAFLQLVLIMYLLAKAVAVFAEHQKYIVMQDSLRF